METIPKKECTKIGFIKKLHGVHGEVTLEFEYDFEASIENASQFFIELEGLLVPFFVEENGFRFRSAKTAIVNFKWIDTEKKAKKLLEKNVYLYNTEIINIETEKSGPEFLGFTLYNENKKEIGEIIQVDDFSGNVVLTVKHKNIELMIPFHNDLVLNLQAEKKIISIKIPDGLL